MRFINIENTKLYSLIIVVILILGFIFRFDNITKHFTHVDDIGLAKTILETREIDLKENIFDKENPSYNSTIKRLLRNNFEKDSNIYKLLNFSYPYLIGTLKNTYAPVNSIIINFLIPNDSNYNEVKFWGRVSSFIFSFSSLIIFYILFLKLNLKNKILLSIFPLTLLSFSFEHIIVSNLMHNYSMSVFCAILFLYLINYEINNYSIKNKIILLNSIIFSICIYLHYQALFLIISMFFYDLFSSYRYFYVKKNSLKKLFKKILIKYLFITILVSPIIIWLYVRNFDSYSWNTGPNNEYLFDINLLKNDFKYIFLFFFENTKIVFSRMISFTSEKNLDNFYMGEIITVLTFSGLLLGICSKNINIKNLSLFCFFYFLISFCFIILSKIALSPTRHSLIFLPIIIFLINNNLIYLYEKIIDKRYILYFPFFYLSLIFLIIGFFLQSYFNEMKLRNDQFNEIEFSKLVEKYNIDTIINYDWTFNTLLMPSVVDKVNHKFINFIPLIADSKNDGEINLYEQVNLNIDDEKIIAFVSAVGPLPHSQIFDVVKNKYPIKNYREYYKELDLFLNNKLKNWEQIYIYENIINKEIEFSSLTHNTPNSIFIYIFKKVW